MIDEDDAWLTEEWDGGDGQNGGKFMRKIENRHKIKKLLEGVTQLLSTDSYA